MRAGTCTGTGGAPREKRQEQEGCGDPGAGVPSARPDPLLSGATSRVGSLGSSHFKGAELLFSRAQSGFSKQKSTECGRGSNSLGNLPSPSAGPQPRSGQSRPARQDEVGGGSGPMALPGSSGSTGSEPLAWWAASAGCRPGLTAASQPHWPQLGPGGCGATWTGMAAPAKGGTHCCFRKQGKASQEAGRTGGDRPGVGGVSPSGAPGSRGAAWLSRKRVVKADTTLVGLSSPSQPWCPAGSQRHRT